MSEETGWVSNSRKALRWYPLNESEHVYQCEKSCDSAPHSLLWKVGGATLKGEYATMMFTNFEGAFDSAPFREFSDVTSERCIDELTNKQMSTTLIIRIQKITSEPSADLVDRIRCLISISRNPTDLVLLEQSVVFMRKNEPRGEKYTDLELKLYGFPIIFFFYWNCYSRSLKKFPPFQPLSSGLTVVVIIRKTIDSYPQAKVVSEHTLAFR